MTKEEMGELDEQDLRHRLARGDFHSAAESDEAAKLLRAFDKQAKFLSECERAAKSSAFDANRNAQKANNIAMFAAIMATIASVCALIALFR